MTEGLSDREEFLESEIETLENALRERARQLQAAANTIQFLESVIHKASAIAGHIPYLCTQVDGSADLENAALQLQRILIHRET